MNKVLSKQEKLYILSFIISFILGTIINQLTFLSSTHKSIITAILFFILFLITWKLFSKLLKKEWLGFKKKIGLNFLICIGLAVGAALLLQFTRSVLPSEWLDSNAAIPETFNLSIVSLVLSTLQPLMAPFYEEIMFRYLFISKANSRPLKIVMLFLQAIIFGLIHTANFGGNYLATIPYMIVALYFGVIYLVTKNIWYSISVHFLFNFSSSILPLLFLLPMLLK